MNPPAGLCVQPPAPPNIIPYATAAAAAVSATMPTPTLRACSILLCWAMLLLVYRPGLTTMEVRPLKPYTDPMNMTQVRTLLIARACVCTREGRSSVGCVCLSMHVACPGGAVRLCAGMQARFVSNALSWACCVLLDHKPTHFTQRGPSARASSALCASLVASTLQRCALPVDASASCTVPACLSR